MTVVEETEQGRDQPSQPAPHRIGEKVRGYQRIHVETDELSPGRGLLALGGGEQPLTFQDVPHRLIADAITQIAQGTDNAVIPPRAISWAMRTTRSSSSLAMRGRPTD